MAGSTTGRRAGKKKRIEHPVRLVIVIYLLVLAVLLGIVYFLPWMNSQMADVMTVSYGDLNSSEKHSFYFVKYETIYLADKSGRAGYSYDEGDMVRTGADAVKISDGKSNDRTDYKNFNSRISSFVSGNSSLLKKISNSDREASVSRIDKKGSSSESESEKLQLKLAASSLEHAGASGSDERSEDEENVWKNDVRKAGITGRYAVDTSGVISYRLDGYETALSPYTMEYLDQEKMEELNTESTDVFDGTVTKGEPVLKVIDNREWYAVTWIDNDDIGKFKKDSPVTLDLDGGSVKGTISRIKKQGDTNLVIIKFDTYYRDLSTLRMEKCRITTSNERGLVVRNSFITEKNGHKGVYRIDVTGKSKFTRIKVLATDGDASLVQAGSFTDKNGNEIETISVSDQIRKAD